MAEKWEDGGCPLTGEQGPNHHSVSTTQHAYIGHVPSQNRAKDTTHLDQGIVSPRLVGARHAKADPAALQIVRQEDVEERVGKANHGPRQPDQAGGVCHLDRGKQATDVEPEFPEGEGLARVGGANGSARLELLQREGARPAILCGERSEVVDEFSIVTLTQQELGRLLETDHGNSQETHDKDQGSHGVHQVPPAHVAGLRARGKGSQAWVGTAVVCCNTKDSLAQMLMYWTREENGEDIAVNKTPLDSTHS